MPRLARLDTAGALNHIIIRGIERQNIFKDNKDKDSFPRPSCLGTLLPETKTACYAWALLSNHAHFLFRTGDTPLSTLMRRLLTGYAVSFNRRYKRHGQLFQNRYKSIICQEDVYLKSRQKTRAEARGLYCYRAVVELGYSLVDLVRLLGMTGQGVGYAVRRGEQIAKAKNYRLIE